MVMNKELQTKKIREKLKKDYPDKDIDSIDIEAMLDNTLTFNENTNAIRKSLSFEMTEEEVIEKAEVYQAQTIRLEEEKTAKEFEIELQRIKTTTSPDLDKYFQPVEDYITAVVRAKNINSLVLLGEAGIGKSYMTIKGLTKMGLKINDDFVIINTHITPLEQYEFLYRNNGKVIVYDDIMKIFQDDVSLGIMLSALWNPTGKRIVSYMSSTDKLNVPKQFEFTGKIIILMNKLPEELDTIKSRAFTLNIQFSWEDKIKIIYELCKLHKIPEAVANWIKENCNKASNLNFRLPFKVYELMTIHPDKWTKLSRLQINFDKEKALAVELITSGKSVKEQTKQFIEETGLSRATFFRWKHDILSQSFIKNL
jgi:hypothetical protein